MIIVPDHEKILRCSKLISKKVGRSSLSAFGKPTADAAVGSRYAKTN